MFLLQLVNGNANTAGSETPPEITLPTTILIFGSLLLLGIIFFVLKTIGKILKKTIVDKIMKD